MGFVAFLKHGWNLPFLVPLGLVVVFFVVQLAGLAAHADGDLDGDGDADGGHDGDADGDGPWAGALAFVGVGRVPFMVVWVGFSICFGFAGLLVNRVASAGGGYPAWALALALAVALVAGVVGARLCAQLAARFVDVGGGGAARKHELTGKLAVVAGAGVDERGGELRVRDGRGNELLVHGRVAAGEPRLPHGAPVVLIDYDERKELFWVAAVPAFAKDESA